MQRPARQLRERRGRPTEATYAALREHFTDEQIVELGYFVSVTYGQQRWIKTLGIGHGEVLGDTTAGLAPSRTEATW